MIDPPRANGELVFEQPWESRVFGVAMALRERGAIDWEEFRAALIERLRAGDAYYRGWQAALEQVLAGQVSADELRERAAVLAIRSSHRH